MMQILEVWKMRMLCDAAGIGDCSVWLLAPNFGTKNDKGKTEIPSRAGQAGAAVTLGWQTTIAVSPNPAESELKDNSQGL